MSGLGFTVFEYLIWVAVAIGLVVVLFVCLALGVAVSSAVNPLAAKWKLISTAKNPHLTETDHVRPIQRNSLQEPEASQHKKARDESLAGELESPEVSSLPERKAS